MADFGLEKLPFALYQGKEPGFYYRHNNGLPFRHRRKDRRRRAELRLCGVLHKSCHGLCRPSALFQEPSAGTQERKGKRNFMNTAIEFDEQSLKWKNEIALKREIVILILKSY